MPTHSKFARLMIIAFVSTLVGPSAFATSFEGTAGIPKAEDQEVPLERYTSYPNISPAADSGGQPASEKGLYQNGMVLPMVFSPKANMTTIYSPSYIINGNNSMISVPQFPMSMPVQTGGLGQQPQPQPQQPQPQNPPLVTPAADQAQSKETPQVEPEKPALPVVPNPPTLPTVANEDDSEYSQRAKLSIKAHVTAQVNPMRSQTIMKDFGATLQKTSTSWEVGPDGKRTNKFRTVIAFFEKEKGPHGVRGCRLITNGMLVRNTEKKIMEVVLEPTPPPKYCLVFKDKKRMRISPIDGSLIVGTAREDAVPSHEPVKFEPKVKQQPEPKVKQQPEPKVKQQPDPKAPDAPKEEPKAQAQVQAEAPQAQGSAK